MVAQRAWRGSFASGSFSNFPNDRAIHARLHSVALPIGASTYPLLLILFLFFGFVAAVLGVMVAGSIIGR
jgi:hypothetical protein